MQSSRLAIHLTPSLFQFAFWGFHPKKQCSTQKPIHLKKKHWYHVSIPKIPIGSNKELTCSKQWKYNSWKQENCYCFQGYHCQKSSQIIKNDLQKKNLLIC